MFPHSAKIACTSPFNKYTDDKHSGLTFDSLTLERGVTFFRGGCSFNMNNKLKSKIRFT